MRKEETQKRAHNILLLVLKQLASVSRVNWPGDKYWNFMEILVLFLS